MFVIPIQDRVDWRRPPFLTLALLILNVAMFAWTLSRDTTLWQRLEQLPLTAMSENEWTPYLAYLEETDPRAWLTMRRAPPSEQQAHLADARMDRQFDTFLSEYWLVHPPQEEWLAERHAWVNARNELSWLRWGFTPAQPEASDSLISLFLHGDVFHLFGNMLFLLLFAIPLEKHWGALRLLMIYLVAGEAGNALYWAVDTAAYMPTVGASGAIAGLMGAYAGTYGFRKIEFFYTFGFIFGSFHAPALIVFPIWLGYELLQSVVLETNINYMAHAGGLIGGLAASLLLSIGRKAPPVIAHRHIAIHEHTNSIPERLLLLHEELAFDQVVVGCQRQLKQQPDNNALWQFYLSTAAKWQVKALDRAMSEALTLLNHAPHPDSLVGSLLVLYHASGGDTARLPPAFRLLEAELYYRQRSLDKALLCTRKLELEWQHPRLEILKRQLESLRA